MEHQSSRRRLQSQYLILYNFISAVLWLAILGRVVLLVPLVGFKNVYGGVGAFAKWTQTLALVEVVHSATGIVRSPLLTTVMQVASRLLLIWGIVNNYPATTSSSPAYSSMLVAWSVSEVIRYSYFVFNLRGSVPAFVRWLRYNTFYVLYPLGICSEMWLIYTAIEPAKTWRVQYEYLLKIILVIYIPGTYVLYTHMMAQRRKMMRGKQLERNLR